MFVSSSQSEESWLREGGAYTLSEQEVQTKEEVRGKYLGFEEGLL